MSFFNYASAFYANNNNIVKMVMNNKFKAVVRSRFQPSHLIHFHENERDNLS